MGWWGLGRGPGGFWRLFGRSLVCPLLLLPPSPPFLEQSFCGGWANWGGGGLELLIIGTGKRTLFLAPGDRKRIAELGVRVDVMDTGSAAAQFNLLATERGGGIAGALLVGGFKG